MTSKEAIYDAFSREFEKAYKNRDGDLKQRVWNASWSKHLASNGQSGFKRSTILLALRMICGES